LVLVACTPHADLDATMNTTTGSSADTQGRPTAILPDDTRITLDVAVTPEELARGLMFRPFLPEDRGMLLLFEEERVPSIWMKNTLVHLDLVFLDNSGQVVDLIERAEPCAADPCPHYIPRHPARTVLEIAAGVAGSHGLKAGDVIEFQQVDGYPVQSAGQTADGD
jgi:uncharacterized membrane protein (UPF0127 family)